MTMMNLHNSAIFIIWLAVQFEIGSCYPAGLAVFRIFRDHDGRSASQHENHAHNAFTTEQPEEPRWNFVHIMLKLQPEMIIKKGENGSQTDEYDYEKIEEAVNRGHDERAMRKGYIFRRNIEVDNYGYAHVFYYFRDKTEMDKEEDFEQVGYHFKLGQKQPKGINDNQKRGNQEKSTEGSTEEKDLVEFQGGDNDDGEVNDNHEDNEDAEHAGDEVELKEENEKADNDDKRFILRAGLKEEVLENYDEDAETVKGLVEDEDEENEESSMEKGKGDQTEVEAENHEDIDGNFEFGKVLVIEGLGDDQKSEREVDKIEKEETTSETKETTSNEQLDIGQIIGSVENIETSTDFVDMITDVYYNSYDSDEIHSGITSSKEELEQEENSSKEEVYNEETVDPSEPLEIKVDFLNNKETEIENSGEIGDDTPTESIRKLRKIYDFGENRKFDTT
ncbi:uncharacterized protein DDB_G0290685 [Nilaparvata lugens]|uniref:uncharacterized protein DDB_G0290685 n=1 Tax=Nilaparvata lugens TaxID=108931 RepID=UPI00193E5B98|nr:uncharacterized protein DDB_G0290685 [Nilaparvata lugens]